MVSSSGNGASRRIRDVISKVSPLAICVMFFLIVVVYLGAVSINVLRYEGRFSPDSVVYLDTARNLLAGNGLSSTIAPLDTAITQDLTLPVPMTTWGPLYPLLIAFLSKLGVELTAAALIIPIVFLAATLGAAFLLLRRCYDVPAALLGVAFLIQFSPLRMVSANAWSETTAIAFMVLFFWLVAEPECTWWKSMLAGVAGGLAFGARYAMLPLFLIGGIACVLGPKGRRAKSLGSFCAGFLIVAGPIIARNCIRAGMPLGAHIPRVNFGYAEVCAGLFRVLADGAAPVAPLADLLLSLLLVAMLVMTYLHARQGELSGVLRDFFAGRQATLLLLWAVVYSALLVRSEVRFAIDPINARLVLPASITLVLLAAGLIARMAGARTWIPVVFALLLAAAALPSEVSMARMLLRSKVAPPYTFDIARSPLYQWISDNVTGEDLLIAEDSFSLPLYMGPIRMLYFESQLPTTKPLRYDDLSGYLGKHRREYAHAYLVLRAGLSRSGPRSPEWGSFLSDLDVGRMQPYPGMSKAIELEDAHVFSIEPPVGSRSSATAVERELEPPGAMRAASRSSSR